MCTSQILNSVGLAFDIAGAIILFIFPIPLVWKNKEGIYNFETPDHVSISRHMKLARTGMGLLLIGFLFQLSANFF
jgi:hypothetical protein